MGDWLYEGASEHLPCDLLLVDSSLCPHETVPSPIHRVLDSRRRRTLGVQKNLGGLEHLVDDREYNGCFQGPSMEDHAAVDFAFGGT